MDEKLNVVIDKIVQLTKQNAEFDAELRKKLGVSSASYALLDDNKINDIYEYCINKVTKQQAEDFYKDFPIENIMDTLIEDYCRMEMFRRKNNFGDFCLAMYQQIENMTNTICANPELQEIASLLWGKPWFLTNQSKGAIPTIEKRGSENFSQTIASFIFYGNDKNGKPNAETKVEIPLNDLYAYDKMRVVVYFIGYKTCMMSNDKKIFSEITNLLNELYQCRNTNHRGYISQSDYVTKTLNKILPLQSFYYSKFHGLLAQYVDFIKDGYPIKDELRNYAFSLKKQK